MKKIALLTLLLVNSLLLGGCLPTIQSASTISSIISVTNDRRSAGVILDDKTIGFKLFIWYNSDVVLEDVHLNFMVYNKTVLITGEVPNKALLSYAVKHAQSQAPQIMQIFTEVTIGPNNGQLSRLKDSAITLQVEALFQNQEVFHTTHVRVMTEAQIIYLMGAVTKREADKAAQFAAKAKGARKVVKLFDYLITRPAAEIERDRLREAEVGKKAELEKLQAELNAKKAELQHQIRALGGTSF